MILRVRPSFRCIHLWWRSWDSSCANPRWPASWSPAHACCGALVLLHRLTELELDRPAATATTWLLASRPNVLVLLGDLLGVPVSPARASLSLLSARRDRWALAGFLALLAALTRSAGVVLFIPLALLAWDSGQRSRMGWALLPLAGPAAFAAYLEIDGPGWRAAFDAQRIWGRELRRSVRRRLGRRHRRSPRRAVDVLARRRRPPRTPERALLRLPRARGHESHRCAPATSASVRCSGSSQRSPSRSATPSTGRPLLSLPRFVAVMFPLWMWLGWWVTRGERWRLRVAWGTSVIGLGACSALFSTWHFVS